MPKVGKSLSMTFFANQQIKPKSMTWKGEIVDAFPLYASVIYGNLTSTIKVERGSTPILVTTDLEQLKEQELKLFVNDFKSRVFSIIKKEIEMANDDYSLAGIGVRLKKYSRLISNVLAQTTLEQLDEPLKNASKSMRIEDEDESRFLLFDAFFLAYRFFKISKTTCEEWVLKDAKKNIATVLKLGVPRYEQEPYIFNDQEINLLTNIIDGALGVG